MKCFYHNDMDGRCAGALVAMYEDNYNKEDYFEVDYIQELPIDKVSNGEKVYFVDYSFKENTKYVLDTLIEKDCDIVWIDHHTSSLNLIEEYPYLKEETRGIIRDGISGAGLTNMYLFNITNIEQCLECVRYVSDYDCWKFELGKDTDYFKLGLETYDFDALDKVWFDLFNLSSTLKIIIKKGKVIKEFIDKDNELYRNNYAYESSIEGHKCLVINKKSNSWIFGDKINEYDIVIVWAFNGEKYSYSIFSIKDNVDCSKIAEKFGGGGHKGASGFSSDKLLLKSI